MARAKTGSQSLKKKTKAVRKLKMNTKEMEALAPKRDNYFKPAVSVKVTRNLARRRVEGPRDAVPLFFLREITLSPLYRKEDKEPYMYQVFTNVSKIGQGSFGDVYKALSKDDSKHYAIKVTNDTHFVVDKGEVRRLEIIPPHKNCIKFFMAWQEDYRIHIKMELCETSLDKYLQIYHNVDERTALEILIDVASGLQHLHSNEMIHLDLKPANVMISMEGVCKIGDFGLVVNLHEFDVNGKKITENNLAISEGDSRYLSVEVLQKKIYTKAADIFSLGMLILETITDVILPTSGPNWVLLREGALPECYYKLDLTPFFRQLIEKMLIKNYKLRPTIDAILQLPQILQILNSRQEGVHFNIMANWTADYKEYTKSDPNRTLNEPGQGPSCQSRPHPINNFSRFAALLRESNSNDNSTAVIGPAGEYTACVMNVARRLF
ncbi:hypothetical protein FQA39_LY07170 [Lamprigera yunnana]|nr:hypothetical protein FQA39_LY07170 [Lamprigera yunnana]